MTEADLQTIADQSHASILDTKDLPPGFGHGTMIAGLVRLVAPAAMIMPLRVFDEWGQGNLGDVIGAIYYAVDNGANVINMSFSTTRYSGELLQAINYAEENGVVSVSSAGNSASEVQIFPATFGNTLGVGSVDSVDGRSDFSNFGNGLVTLAASGEALVTAFPGGLYAAAWGTSFSSAIVSGTVALMHQVAGSNLVPIDQAGAKHAFKKASVTLPLDLKLGKGRLDIADAMDCGLTGGSCNP